MKKERLPYVKPSVRVVKVRLEQLVCLSQSITNVDEANPSMGMESKPFRNDWEETFGSSPWDE